MRVLHVPGQTRNTGDPRGLNPNFNLLRAASYRSFDVACLT